MPTVLASSSTLPMREYQNIRKRTDVAENVRKDVMVNLQSILSTDQKYSMDVVEKGWKPIWNCVYFYEPKMFKYTFEILVEEVN